MRHKKKRILELSTGVQKKQNVIRNLLTSLVGSGQMVTTIKRSKVLKSTADKFFARLV
jgi:ribosomal protein L17